MEIVLVSVAVGSVAESADGHRFYKYKHKVGLMPSVCHKCGQKIYDRGWTGMQGTYHEECLTLLAGRLVKPNAV